MCNITKEENVDAEVAILAATEDVVMKTTMKRGDKRTTQTRMDKTAIVEEVVVQIVQMLNVTTAKKMDTTQRIAMPRRKWKKMTRKMRQKIKGFS